MYQQNKPIQLIRPAAAHDPSFVPIKSLCPQTMNPKIKARVTMKSEVKYFKMKNGGEGKLFSIEI